MRRTNFILSALQFDTNMEIQLCFKVYLLNSHVYKNNLKSSSVFPRFIFILSSLKSTNHYFLLWNFADVTLTVFLSNYIFNCRRKGCYFISYCLWEHGFVGCFPPTPLFLTLKWKVFFPWIKLPRKMSAI